jgi:hypothetical protein
MTVKSSQLVMPLVCKPRFQGFLASSPTKWSKAGHLHYCGLLLLMNWMRTKKRRACVRA